MIMIYKNCIYIKDMIIYYRNENIVNYVDDKMIIRLRGINIYVCLFKGELKHFSSAFIKNYIINEYERVLVSISYDVSVRESVISFIFESNDFISFNCEFN